ncbi:MAG TPA: hypothetical protein DCO72_04385 [Ruminococcus sp.]|nr:hypothetical protein [Ruminococcus sp.]
MIRNSNVQLQDEFKQWVVHTEDGVESVTRYCYKIEEVLDEESGYRVSEISAPIVAKMDSAELRLTNKKDQDMMKYAIDSNGNEISEIDLSKVPKRKISMNGTETDCYIFGWKLYFKDGQSKYTDTLPNGAFYISGSEVGLSEYAPKIVNSQNWETGLQDYWLIASASGSTVSIDLKDDAFKIFYNLVVV